MCRHADREYWLLVGIIVVHTPISISSQIIPVSIMNIPPLLPMIGSEMGKWHNSRYKGLFLIASGSFPSPKLEKRCFSFLLLLFHV